MEAIVPERASMQRSSSSSALTQDLSQGESRHGIVVSVRPVDQTSAPAVLVEATTSTESSSAAPRREGPHNGCPTTPDGSDARGDNQGTLNEASAMSTVLFDRTRPTQAGLGGGAVCVPGVATACTSTRVTSARHSVHTTATYAHTGEDIAPERGRDTDGHPPGDADDGTHWTLVSHTHSGVPITDGAHSASTTYVLRLNSPHSGSTSGTGMATEARQLLFEDGDDTGAAGRSAESTQSARSRHASLPRPSPDLRASAPRARVTEAADGDHEDAGDSPEPRAESHALAVSSRASGRRSDEGLVPSLARGDSEDNERSPANRAEEPLHRSLPLPHEDAADLDHIWTRLTLHRSPSVTADDAREQFAYVAAALSTTTDATAATREDTLTRMNRRSADEEALVNSRSRTRDASGSLALLPPPPPPPIPRAQDPSPSNHGCVAWLSPPVGRTSRSNSAVTRGEVSTPSAERALSRPRRLLPPPPPPPPPFGDSTEPSSDRTPPSPPPPSRPVRVLCAPSPSPPRTAVTSDEREREEVPDTPLPIHSQRENPRVAVGPTASPCATASVLDMATPRGDDSDSIADATGSEWAADDEYMSEQVPASHDGHGNDDAMDRVTRESSRDVPAHSATTASALTPRQEEDDGKAQMVSPVQPVSTVMPGPLLGTLVMADTHPHDNTHAPPQTSGSPCLINQVLLAALSSPEPVLEADVAAVRAHVESAALPTSELPGITLATEPSPSPIRPSGESHSFSSEMFDDDDEQEDEENEDGSEPCLRPGTPPSESRRPPLEVSECRDNGPAQPVRGAVKQGMNAADRNNTTADEEEIGNEDGRVAAPATTELSSSLPSCSCASSASHCSSHSYREPVVMSTTTAAIAPHVADQDGALLESERTPIEALRAALACETERRLQKEEECEALHDLVSVLREKLDMTTVAALAHQHDRRAMNHTSDSSRHHTKANFSHLHQSALTESVLAGRGLGVATTADNAGATGPATTLPQSSHALSSADGGADHDAVVEVGMSAEALLWQARHDQLAAELSRVKQELAEQRAVLDLLGLAPPYPEALLGAAKQVVRRLTHRTPPPSPPTHNRRNCEQLADASALLEHSAVAGTPVPIIATLYCHGERAGADGSSQHTRETHALPWSQRQERAASVARRALSELSANAVQLNSVERVLAKSQVGNARGVGVSEIESVPARVYECGGGSGLSVAEALRRNKTAAPRFQEPSDSS